MEQASRPESQEEARRLFEDFLVHEARLMDTHQFAAWLELWAEDGTYFVPCNKEDVDPARELSIIYEGYDGLRERVRRLNSKFAHAQQPRSRVSRVISNFELDGVDADRISGNANFVLGEVRRNRQIVWFGRTHHVLRRTPAGLKIHYKKVVMLNNDIPMPNLTFLV